MFQAVVSKKGGVGKTTTAVNLAGALAEQGLRTLLVDLDPQASASRSLGVPRAQLGPSAADLLGRAQFEDVVRRTTLPKLDLVTSSVDLMRAEEDLKGYQRPYERLRDKLAAARELYDHVLFDCAPGLGALPTSALLASDAFLLPATPHFLAIEGLQNFVQAVERLGFRHGHRVPCAGVVLTQVDYRTKATRSNVALVREQLGELVCAVEVRIATKLAEAPASGQTIGGYAPHSPAHLSFDNLADELLLRLGRAERSTASAASPVPDNVTRIDRAQRTSEPSSSSQVPQNVR
ncbi:MAG: ParA family protein [Acidobacteriota bacterium]